MRRAPIALDLAELADRLTVALEDADRQFDEDYDRQYIAERLMGVMGQIRGDVLSAGQLLRCTNCQSHYGPDDDASVVFNGEADL